MQSERTHPLAYALTVTRALWELASDAINTDLLPKPVAAAMSGAANSAAVRLERFLAIKQGAFADGFSRSLGSIQSDLETVAHLTGLIVTQDMAPKTAVYVAIAVRYTVEQAAKRLKHLEDDLDH